MGKKRIVKKEDSENVASKNADTTVANNTPATSSKKRFNFGILHVQSTYNNTKVLLTDSTGNALAASSSGALGFSGAKKGTPFDAAKVGETVGLKAQTLGIADVAVVVRGVGSGRESAIRGFISKSIGITSIKDATPVPFNGPKPKKARRV